MRRLRLSARWVVPVSHAPVENGAVLVEDGVIVAAGPDAVVPSPDDAERVHLGEAALLPGLINVHAHPELTAFRGLLDDLPFHSWIPTLNALKRTVQPAAEDYGVAARWCCIESLRAGITTIGATEDSGAALDALVEAGMRGIAYREVFGPAPAQADESLRGLIDKVDDMRRRETGLVRVGVSPHAPYTVSDALFAGTAEFARAERLPIAVHTAEAAVEDDLVRRGTGVFAQGLQKRGIETPVRGRSTVELLHRLGVLEAQPLLIHCVRLDAEDMALIAGEGATVAHCPVANARLGHGTAPVPEMLDAGITVAIGTDSVASNNRLDLLGEAHIAQVVQRARTLVHDSMPSTQLLRMITLDAARVLGMDSRIGSIEAGKDADFCAVRLASPHTRPVVDVHDSIFHAARGSDVILTMVRGRALMRDGRVESLSEAALRPALDGFAARLRAAR